VTGPRGADGSLRANRFGSVAEFRTILEMGLREAYPHRAVAVFAYEALKDTHTEHPAALGFNQG
jgi:hypothetical protein